MSSFLPANRILRDLPEPDLLAIRPHLDLIKFEQNETLHRRGDPLTYFYFIERGLVLRVKNMTDGRTVVVGTMGLEGVTESYTLFEADGAMSEFDLVAAIVSKTWRISRKALETCANEMPSLRNSLSLFKTYTINQFAQLAACNLVHTIQERCCRWLLAIHDNARAGTCSWAHETLPLILGKNRTTVSLTLNNLKQAGFIQYNGSQIEIIDRNGLEFSTCECHGSMRDDLSRLFSQARADQWPTARIPPAGCGFG